MRQLLQWDYANKHIILDSSPLRKVVRAGFHLISPCQTKISKNREAESVSVNQKDSLLKNKQTKTLSWCGIGLKWQQGNCKESTILYYVTNFSLSSLVLLMCSKNAFC